MFDHFVVSVVVCPVLVALTVRWLAGRLRPEAAVTVLVVSIVTAAAACLVSLAAFALKAVAELHPVAVRLGFSDAVVRADTSREPWAPGLSVVLLLVAVAGLTRVWRRHRREDAVAAEFRGLPVGTDRVALIDDTRAEAFAVPGTPGRVVVTTGMRAALNDQQYGALLAHERAHLDSRHHQLVLLARLAAAVHPAFRWVTRRIEFLVERAADERAAEQVGDRRVVATAIGAAALRATHTRAGLPITPARQDLRAAGVVPRRVASLLAPRFSAGLLTLVAVPVSVAAASVIWTGECVADLGELLYAAGMLH
ncbi:membrane protein [Paractinoplanes abujensis]|uniref:Zn-dependent protease with chaperone function n=1 Tax=Paractinoplanes abujensis TaxID=882441 RepID=A0A7W7G021_9ACTN|nr:M56 family metallopeptidase [Actinoplanes abujensis]MBB4691149.1 Zn-dependent protease with chaperone function [Actinoplanes abujensis]GID17436.1 membrane protein [Actinoplanes abujensis]